MAKSLLEKLNMFSDKFNVVFRATNGGEIVEFAKTNNTFQVILMDIEMPKMDGIKATELISKFRPEIKTIILTVFDDDEKYSMQLKLVQVGIC